MPRGVLIFALLAASCTMTRLPPRADTATRSPAERIAAECALLHAARSQRPALHSGLLEGCPGTSARDRRPLAEQTASTRAANAAVLPSGVPAGSRAEVVYRRMITRGVPVALAETLSAGPIFADAVR